MKIRDNSISTVLGEAGLSHSERQVYIAGAQRISVTSRELIQFLNLPRPTVMAALKTLTDNGLCDTHRLDGRTFSYHMQPLAMLKASVGKRMRQLDELMDRLDGLQIEKGRATAVQESVGQEAVQDMLELALRCKSRKWQIIAPHANALSFMPEQYKSYFKRVRRERQIESQSLWELSSKKEIPLRDVLMRKPRYVPDDLSESIPSLMLAFDDCLLIIDMDKTMSPSAVLLQNKAITETFQIIFEMAWRSVKV